LRKKKANKRSKALYAGKNKGKRAVMQNVNVTQSKIADNGECNKGLKVKKGMGNRGLKYNLYHIIAKLKTSKSKIVVPACIIFTLLLNIALIGFASESGYGTDAPISPIISTLDNRSGQDISHDSRPAEENTTNVTIVLPGRDEAAQNEEPEQPQPPEPEQLPQSPEIPAVELFPARIEESYINGRRSIILTYVLEDGESQSISPEAILS